MMLPTLRAVAVVRPKPGGGAGGALAPTGAPPPGVPPASTIEHPRSATEHPRSVGPISTRSQSATSAVATGSSQWHPCPWPLVGTRGILRFLAGAIAPLRIPGPLHKEAKRGSVSPGVVCRQRGGSVAANREARRVAATRPWVLLGALLAILAVAGAGCGGGPSAVLPTVTTTTIARPTTTTVARPTTTTSARP